MQIKILNPYTGTIGVELESEDGSNIKLFPKIKVFRSYVQDPNILTLINGYIKYRGPVFGKMLFNVVKEIESNITTFSFEKVDFVPSTKRVIKALELDKLTEYVRNNIKIPTYIPVEYKDVKGTTSTRKQTFIRDEYYGLVALAVAMKLLVPIIDEMLQVCSLESYNAGEILAELDHVGIKKLMIVIDNMLEMTPGGLKTVTLKRDISSSSIRLELLYIVLVRLFSVTVENDTMTSNVITVSYNTINPIINGTVGLYNFNPMGFGDEQESILEASRYTTDINAGDVTEFRWAARNIGMIAKVIGVDEEDIIKHIEMYNVLDKGYIIPSIVYTIVGIIMHNVIDPRAIIRMRAIEMKTLLAASYTKAIKVGNKPLIKTLTLMEDYANVYSLDNKPRKKITNASADELFITKEWKGVKKSILEDAYGAIDRKVYININVTDGSNKYEGIPQDIKQGINDILVTVVNESKI